MRYPAEETAEKHRKILHEAARLFRQHGFDGVSVGEIMRATGLTHGPFYNHFESKEALMKESVEHRGAEMLAEMDSVCSAPAGLQAYISGYLSMRHRDSARTGCLIAALGVDASREPAVRASFTGLVGAMIERFMQALPGRPKKAARSESIRMLASMVGALVLARAVDDDPLATEILKDVRAALP